MMGKTGCNDSDPSNLFQTVTTNAYLGTSKNKPIRYDTYNFSAVPVSSYLQLRRFPESKEVYHFISPLYLSDRYLCSLHLSKCELLASATFLAESFRVLSSIMGRHTFLFGLAPAL